MTEYKNNRYTFKEILSLKYRVAKARLASSSYVQARDLTRDIKLAYIAQKALKSPFTIIITPYNSYKEFIKRELSYLHPKASSRVQIVSVSELNTTRLKRGATQVIIDEQVEFELLGNLFYNNPELMINTKLSFSPLPTKAQANDCNRRRKLSNIRATLNM